MNIRENHIILNVSLSYNMQPSITHLNWAHLQNIHFPYINHCIFIISLFYHFFFPDNFAIVIGAIEGYFWHITDLHLDTAYSTRGDVTKSKFVFILSAIYIYIFLYMQKNQLVILLQLNIAFHSISYEVFFPLFHSFSCISFFSLVLFFSFI